MWRAPSKKVKELASVFHQPTLRSRRFFGAWIRSPFAMGALMPSSRALARAIAEQVRLEREGTVIELGAGTGVVTQALLQTGLAPERLLIVERDAKLANFLSTHFPHLHIVCADAMRLDEVMASLNIQTVNAVVSSLPLLSMPRGVRHAIEQQMVSAIMGHAGRIIQFTYGPKSPISKHTLHKFHLSAMRSRTVMANVPPAHVWVYELKSN